MFFDFFPAYRVRSLLRVKKLNDRLLDAHGHINALADQTARLLKTFNPHSHNQDILYANWPESTAGCQDLQELFAPCSAGAWVPSAILWDIMANPWS